MFDHAGLRECERDEHAQRVEGDQPGDLAAKSRQEDRSRYGQDHDPVGIGKPVATEGELAGGEAVAGKDRAEGRKAVETGVRGEEQDKRGPDLVGVVEDVLAHRGLPQLRDDRLASRLRLLWY